MIPDKLKEECKRGDHLRNVNEENPSGFIIESI